MQESSQANRERWYALHTKPHKEFAARDLMEQRGIRTYLPSLKVEGKRLRRAAAEKPFFTCYLFARVDFSQVAPSSINWTPGITSVVQFGGRPAQVDDEVIQWLQERLARMAGMDYHQGLPLRPGDRLRITRGPLKGMEAVFDRRLSSADRARVFIEILGRLTPCQVDFRSLKRP